MPAFTMEVPAVVMDTVLAFDMEAILVRMQLEVMLDAQVPARKGEGKDKGKGKDEGKATGEGTDFYIESILLSRFTAHSIVCTVKGGKIPSPY